ncbi:MAG TPA: hypothetical protein ENI97_00780 [Gammaproteobacteria bacterium]|nr:hypothetical protein [Gammaproteobacteria bacterium]
MKQLKNSESYGTGDMNIAVFFHHSGKPELSGAEVKKVWMRVQASASGHVHFMAMTPSVGALVLSSPGRAYIFGDVVLRHVIYKSHVKNFKANGSCLCIKCLNIGLADIGEY